MLRKLVQVSLGELAIVTVLLAFFVQLNTYDYIVGTSGLMHGRGVPFTYFRSRHTGVLFISDYTALALDAAVMIIFTTLAVTVSRKIRHLIRRVKLRPRNGNRSN